MENKIENLTKKQENNLEYEEKLVFVTRLFNEFFILYGSRFTSKFYEKNGNLKKNIDMDLIKSRWISELSKLSRLEIKTGILRLKDQDYSPDLADFLKLCKHSYDARALLNEAVQGFEKLSSGRDFTFSHPAIYWAGVKVDINSLDFKSSIYNNIQKRWEMALQEEFDKNAWDAIPKPKKQLGSALKSISEASQAKANLAILKDLIKNGKLNKLTSK